jgi:RNA-directed DNA polymerase
MSDCHMARNGADKVRNLQRALYRKSKQEKEVRFYSLYDKVWREDVLWEAWRQVKANHGAPGIDGKVIEEIVATGQEEAMIEKLQAALRAHCYQFAPVRVVEIPKPKGGTRPLGIATVEDRVVQTAMKLVLEPIFEADFHDCSYGYRPKRDAKPASIAIREDLYNQAWGVVEIDCQSSFTSIPHGKLMKLSTKRIAAGRMLKVIKQTLKVGMWDKGQVVPTKLGVPQGSPISPLYSTIYLKPARKSVGGSRAPKRSASSGGYGYQPQPRLPRRTAQDSGADQRILCGTASPTPPGPAAHLLWPGLPAAGGGGGGAADVQTPGVVHAFDQGCWTASTAGV